MKTAIFTNVMSKIAINVSFSNEGEDVRVQFRLPNSRTLSKFKAQVIWTASNSKAGLAFTRMSSADRELLSEWIDGEFLRVFASADKSRFRSLSNTPDYRSHLDRPAVSGIRVASLRLL
jgi:hypothetical protein